LTSEHVCWAINEFYQSTRSVRLLVVFNVVFKLASRDALNAIESKHVLHNKCISVSILEGTASSVK